MPANNNQTSKLTSKVDISQIYFQNSALWISMLVSHKMIIQSPDRAKDGSAGNFYSNLNIPAPLQYCNKKNIGNSCKNKKNKTKEKKNKNLNKIFHKKNVFSKYIN